jgi:ribosomal protein L16 Arg81 hydroxylase
MCIAPVTPRHFLATYLNKRPLYCSDRGYTSEAMPQIANVNDILSRMLVAPGALRLVHNECTIDESEYLMPPITTRSVARSIKTAALETYMRDGATLALNHCESWFAPLDALCQSISIACASRVTATLIVTLAPGTPTGLHWDGSDVLAYQISGAKTWSVFHPVLERSLRNSRPGEISSPAPAMCETLGPGDTLYVPAGWPHQVVAVTVPSVHVSMDFARPTGVDLLKRVLGNLIERLPVRRDLPVLDAQDARRAYASELRALVQDELSDDKINAYCAAYLLSLTRPPLSLRTHDTTTT